MNTSGTKNKLSDIKVHYITHNMVGNEVLDVGAGYGYYSEWLVNQNPNLKVVALDQLDLINYNGVQFLSTDLENPIPLAHNSFSTILAFDIIEHIKNEKLFIKELFRVCKPKGMLIGSVPHDDDKFLPKYNLTFRHRSDLTHKRYYIPNTLKDALEQGGFQVLTIEPKGIVSPQFFAEFFRPSLRPLVKKSIGLFRRLKLINTNVLASDLFFVARKK
jgi:SAM-dependent methyltransferase